MNLAENKTIAHRCATPQEDEALAQMKKISENKFDYNDFLAQFKAMSDMGGMSGMMKLMPGMKAVTEKQIYQVYSVPPCKLI